MDKADIDKKGAEGGKSGTETLTRVTESSARVRRQQSQDPTPSEERPCKDNWREDDEHKTKAYNGLGKGHRRCDGTTLVYEKEICYRRRCRATVAKSDSNLSKMTIDAIKRLLPELKDLERNDGPFYTCFRHRTKEFSRVPYVYVKADYSQRKETIAYSKNEQDTNHLKVQEMIELCIERLDELDRNLKSGGIDNGEIEQNIEQLTNRMDLLGEIVKETELNIHSDSSTKISQIKTRIDKMHGIGNMGQELRVKLNELIAKTTPIINGEQSLVGNAGGGGGGDGAVGAGGDGDDVVGTNEEAKHDTYDGVAVSSDGGGDDVTMTAFDAAKSGGKTGVVGGGSAGGDDAGGSEKSQPVLETMVRGPLTRNRATNRDRRSLSPPQGNGGSNSRRRSR